MKQILLPLTILLFLFSPNSTQASYLIKSNGQIQTVPDVLGEEEYTKKPKYEVDDYKSRPTPVVDEYWKRPSPVEDNWKSRPTPVVDEYWKRPSPVEDNWRERLGKPTLKAEPTKAKPTENEIRREDKKPFTTLTPKPSRGAEITRSPEDKKPTTIKIVNKNKEIEVKPGESVKVESKDGSFMLKKDLKNQSVELSSPELPDKVEIQLPVEIDPKTQEVSVERKDGRKQKIDIEKLQESIEYGLGNTDPSVGVGTSIVEEEGRVLFKIESKKKEKLFGFMPVEIEIQSKIDVEDGQTISTEKTTLNKILDFFSF